MAEVVKCPYCQEYINLEIEIYRDNQNNIYCSKCNGLIDLNEY